MKKAILRNFQKTADALNIRLVKHSFFKKCCNWNVASSCKKGHHLGEDVLIRQDDKSNWLFFSKLLGKKSFTAPQQKNEREGARMEESWCLNGKHWVMAKEIKGKYYKTQTDINKINRWSELELYFIHCLNHSLKIMSILGLHKIFFSIEEATKSAHTP